MKLKLNAERSFLSALGILRCVEVDLTQKSLKDGFVSHDYSTEKAHGPEEETIKAFKRVQNGDGVSLTVIMQTVSAVFRFRNL